MSDGTFSGTQSMTRAQACTVIVRMMKLINNYNPGDADNDTYDDGTSQKTLANGQPITTGNVTKILQEIRAKYPNGTQWGSNTRYSGMAGEDMLNINKQFISAQTNIYGGSNMNLACGGFASMVSDTIFGKTGFPARQVTNAKDIRPGDIIIQLNSEGKLVHYYIASSSAIQNQNGQWVFTVCSGNDGGKVVWNTTPGILTANQRAFTRYPD